MPQTLPIQHPHAEVVGSLLRSPELVAARKKLRAGELDPVAMKALEDKSIDDALKLQESVGLEVVTDGEIRRNIFFDFFATGMSGLSFGKGDKVQFKNHDGAAMEVDVPLVVTEKVEPLECPGVAEFNYTKEKTDKLIKVTLPSPMMMLGFWTDLSKEVYPDPFELAADAAEAVRGWMRQLADAGCKYIQIDAPEVNEAYADAEVRADLKSKGIDPDEYIRLGTEFLGTFGDLDLTGVRKCLHVCKGNGTQSWIAEGGYDDFSRSVFDRASGFDVFHLEYDDARSGSFEPLKNLPDDKIAVLGMVSTKWTRMEPVEELTKRIHEAAQFHPLDKLGLATQCGFASAAETAEGRKITDAVQIAKLQRVTETAHAVWG